MMENNKEKMKRASKYHYKILRSIINIDIENKIDKSVILVDALGKLMEAGTWSLPKFSSFEDDLIRVLVNSLKSKNPKLQASSLNSIRISAKCMDDKFSKMASTLIPLLIDELRKSAGDSEIARNKLGDCEDKNYDYQKRSNELSANTDDIIYTLKSIVLSTEYPDMMDYFLAYDMEDCMIVRRTCVECSLTILQSYCIRTLMLKMESLNEHFVEKFENEKDFLIIRILELIFKYIRGIYYNVSIIHGGLNESCEVNCPCKGYSSVNIPNHLAANQNTAIENKRESKSDLNKSKLNQNTWSIVFNEQKQKEGESLTNLKHNGSTQRIGYSINNQDNEHGFTKASHIDILGRKLSNIKSMSPHSKVNDCPALLVEDKVKHGGDEAVSSDKKIVSESKLNLKSQTPQVLPTTNDESHQLEESSKCVNASTDQCSSKYQIRDIMVKQNSTLLSDKDFIDYETEMEINNPLKEYKIMNAIARSINGDATGDIPRVKASRVTSFLSEKNTVDKSSVGREVSNSEIIRKCNSECSDSSISYCESSLEKEIDEYTDQHFALLKNKLFGMIDGTVTSTCQKLSDYWNNYTLTNYLKLNIGRSLRNDLIHSLGNLSEDDVHQLFEDLENDGNSRKLGQIHFDKIEGFTLRERHEIVTNIMKSLIRKLKTYNTQFANVNISDMYYQEQYCCSMEKNLHTSIVRGCFLFVDEVTSLVCDNQLYNEKLLKNYLKSKSIISLQLCQGDYRITGQMYEMINKDNDNNAYSKRKMMKKEAKDVYREKSKPIRKFFRRITSGFGIIKKSKNKPDSFEHLETSYITD